MFVVSLKMATIGIGRNLQRAAFCLATKSYNSGVITLLNCLVIYTNDTYCLSENVYNFNNTLHSFKNIVLYNGRTCSWSPVNVTRNCATICSSSKFCSAVLFWHSSVDVAVRTESDAMHAGPVTWSKLFLQSPTAALCLPLQSVLLIQPVPHH